MSYDSKMLKFDYTFTTCEGSEDETADEEATKFCSEMGKRGYKLTRWYIRDGTHYIVMEKHYRG